jgi:hypothetical protein
MQPHVRSWRNLTLEQPSASVILEYLGIADIAPERIDRPMPAYVHHLEDGSAPLCRRRQEASSQGVAGEYLRIKPDALGMGLDDSGHALVGKPLPNLVAIANRAEQQPGGDTGRIAPMPAKPRPGNYVRGCKPKRCGL